MEEYINIIRENLIKYKVSFSTMLVVASSVAVIGSQIYNYARKRISNKKEKINKLENDLRV